MARRIIGIDPGLQRMGWGVIDCLGDNRLVHVGHGVCRSDASHGLAERLHSLFLQLQQVLTAWVPEEAAVEETFVNNNAQSALKLGHARAMALVAPALFGIPVFEYAPNVIKKTVVGAGHADKTQILYMMRIFFPPLKNTPTPIDAIDALAIAVCHAHHPKPSLKRPFSAGYSKVRSF